MIEKEKDAPTKGVIYARYSSSGQREESIEGQIRECHAFADRYGIKIVGEYCDHALTGTSDKRPEFQRMIRDSARGQFSVVITWKNDRFARSRYDSAIYKAKLKANGVRVMYAKESIPDGPEGIILESVMEGYAEYYSANLSQNVKRGLYDSALKLQTLGQSCYGLQKGADGRWEQNPSQAPIVRRIFDEYLAGRPATDIYRDLNAEGYRTITGKPFNKNSLGHILHNERYCGVYEYADIRVEDGIPAIVTRDMFDRAQAMQKLHAEKPAAKKIDGGFLLTGKLFCGQCGEPMTGDGGTGKSGRVYQYYTCVNRRKKTCTKERAKKDWIEDLIVHKLVEIANDDDVIDAFADRFMEWQEANRNTSEASALEARLRKVETAISNTMSMIDSGFITESLKSHLVDLEAERTDLENGIAQAAIAAPDLKRSEVVFFLRKFREGDIDDAGWRIYLVDTFLQSAYLFDDGRLLLVLNYSGKNNTVTVQIALEAIENGEPMCSGFAQSGRPKKANLNTATVFFFNGLLIAQIFATKKG